MGRAGALIGVVLGMGVEYAFPTVLGKLLPLRPEIRLPLNPVLAALGTGILTTLLFCLPPLLDVRSVRPSLVLRRMVESGDGTAGGLGWLKEHKLQLGSIVVILGGLGGIAAALADSAVVGKWFAICLAGLLVFILGLSAATLRGLRAFLSRTRLHLHSALRHGLANLYRPGNQSSAVLAALGTGVMLILSVFLMQRSIVNALHEDLKPETPNLFLIDMSTNEMPGIRAELKKQPGVLGDLEAIPIISARLESIDGTPVDELKGDYPKRMMRTATLSWANAAPMGTKIAEGKWWSGDGGNDLAVVDFVAKRLKLKIGSQITFVAGEKEIPVKVAAIYKVVGENAFARSSYILPEALLTGSADGVVRGHSCAAERDSGDRAGVVRDVSHGDRDQYCGHSDRRFGDVVDQITIVIRFLAGFSILSGLIILASSIASTRFRRMREVVVLKTLGATRNRIATVFSVEFLVLGLLAGAVGTPCLRMCCRGFCCTGWMLSSSAMCADRDRGVGDGMLAVATGWIASFQILGQKPLEVLREE